MESITTRKHVVVPEEPNPFLLKHFDVQVNENGEKKLVETPAVAPSMAEDFDVNNNAMYRGQTHGVYRVSADPVDFENKISNLLNV